jgi:hypothetical protein
LKELRVSLQIFICERLSKFSVLHFPKPSTHLDFSGWQTSRRSTQNLERSTEKSKCVGDFEAVGYAHKKRGEQSPPSSLCSIIPMYFYLTLQKYNKKRIRASIKAINFHIFSL